MMEGKFIGSDLDSIACDRIALHRVSATLLRKEVKLATTAWFDYRLMHPTVRTYLFAHCYDKAYQFIIQRDLDYEQVAGDNPRSYFPKLDPLGQSRSEIRRKAKSFRNCTSLWKARQKADELGIPYDVYCMSTMLAADSQIWQHRPTPSHMHSERLVIPAIERWLELLKTRLFYAEDPFYQLENWCNHPSQHEHVQWLIEQITSRINPEFTLAQCAFIRPMIPVQALRSQFSGDLILRAKKISDDFKSDNPL